MVEIKNRSEIVFLYDIKDANPNGDPLDENKPRIDEETGINIVTDVRLKRTIRDYLMNFKGYNGKADKDIFVREIADVQGNIQDSKARAKDFNEDHAEILKKCIDARLFGAVIPLEKGKSKEGGAITYIGPVQFKMGRSLHKVEIKHIKGTGAFASGKGLTQKTFGEEDILHYSLISFYGIINENAAKHTNLTEEDINLLLEGMWDGTKNLISRSKAGQMPRLLLKVNYKENNYHIGDLDKMIKIESEKNDEQIRDISEITLDVSELIETLNKNKDMIKSIDLKLDDRLKLKIDFNELDKEIPINKI